jgi:hypothetical protein
VICCEHKAGLTKLESGPIELQKSQSQRNCSGSLSHRPATALAVIAGLAFFAK